MSRGWWCVEHRETQSSSLSTPSSSIRKMALISDVHIFDSEGVANESIEKFLNLRLLGLLNILLLRGPDKFSEHVLRAALNDMVEREGVDHLILAGDITNLSLECEFSKTARMFARFGSGDTKRITAVPGNHDVYNRMEANRRPTLFSKYFGGYAQSDIEHPRYLRMAARREVTRGGLNRWRRLGRRRIPPESSISRMVNVKEREGRCFTTVATQVESDERSEMPSDRKVSLPDDESSNDRLRHQPGDDFPFVHRRGDVLFIGLNTALPGTAQGEVGVEQWNAARQMLRTTSSEDLMSQCKCRILVLHHPAQDPNVRGLPWIREIGHDLKDWAEIPSFASEFGIDLVVHGHNHVPYAGWLAGAANTLVVEGGSGTLLDVTHPERMARYTVFELGEQGGIERMYARVWNYDRYGNGASLLSTSGKAPDDAFITREIEIPRKPSASHRHLGATLRKRCFFGSLPF